MLIQITNKCLMGCRHCLNDSTPEGGHMSLDTWAKCIQHIQDTGSKVVLISGGEPTEHPYWNTIVEEASYKFWNVVVTTNGMWINTDKEAVMLDILRKHDNCSVQITSHGSYYPRHNQTCTAVRKFKQRLKNSPYKALRKIEFNQINACIDTDIHLVALGRATKDEMCLHLSELDTAVAASCFMGALVAAQTDYKSAVAILEGRGHFCRPRINWKGEIGWSESALCPNFATVDDKFEDIVAKVKDWLPCGKCKGWEKVKNSTDPQYVQARSVLGRNHMWNKMVQANKDS